MPSADASRGVGGRGLAVIAAALSLALGGPASARIDSSVALSGVEDDASRVAIFYYPWFGTAARDGEYHHWAQGGAVPPEQIGSRYFPARGIYSSADVLVVAAQMDEIAAAGIDTVIVSWWGIGSREDEVIPRIALIAQTRGLRVAAHLEPYSSRTAASTERDIGYLRTLGIADFYVYGSDEIRDTDWADVNRRLTGVRTFANTFLPGKAARGGFEGLYTYDVLMHGGDVFSRMCGSARRIRLLCAPSVGPGFDAERATLDPRLRPRRNGATYDHMWASALRASPDLVTITSYNEWAEGTQIEPARASTGYESYDGAWRLAGKAAQTAYLARTRYWAERFTRPWCGFLSTLSEQSQVDLSAVIERTCSAIVTRLASPRARRP